MAPWGAAALLLLLPILGMLVSDEVSWGPGDFVAAAVLLFGACVVYETAARSRVDRAYRAAVGIALASALGLVWINLAVGIFGSEDNPANLMFVAVLAIGFTGAIAARFRPAGMARAMVAAAAAQASVVLIGLVAGFGSTGPSVVLGGGFAALWLLCACLFRRAASMPQTS